MTSSALREFRQSFLRRHIRKSEMRTQEKTLSIKIPMRFFYKYNFNNFFRKYAMCIRMTMLILAYVATCLGQLHLKASFLFLNFFFRRNGIEKKNFWQCSFEILCHATGKIIILFNSNESWNNMNLFRSFLGKSIGKNITRQSDLLISR